MRQIYKGKLYTMYSQVVLVDLESPDDNTYPLWSGDLDQKAVFAPRGIAVGTTNDVDVQVVAYVGEGPPSGRWVHLGSGMIEVGNLSLGLESPAGDSDVLEWPTGNVPVDAYVNSTDREKIKRVAFIFRA